MTTRRNPDFFMDLLTIGVLGFGGLWVVNQINHAAQQVSNAVPGVVYNATAPGAKLFEGYSTPPGVSHDVAICQAINTWRTVVVPPHTCLFALPCGGFDPHDWNAFRAWAQTGTDLGDPGATPPSCW